MRLNSIRFWVLVSIFIPSLPALALDETAEGICVQKLRGQSIQWVQDIREEWPGFNAEINRLKARIMNHGLPYQGQMTWPMEILGLSKTHVVALSRAGISDLKQLRQRIGNYKEGEHFPGITESSRKEIRSRLHIASRFINAMELARKDSELLATEIKYFIHLPTFQARILDESGNATVQAVVSGEFLVSSSMAAGRKIPGIGAATVSKIHWVVPIYMNLVRTVLASPAPSGYRDLPALLWKDIPERERPVSLVDLILDYPPSALPGS